MLLTILVVLLVASLLGGVWGNQGGRTYGYRGWSPFGILLVVLLVLWLTGNLGALGWGSPNRGPFIHERR